MEIPLGQRCPRKEDPVYKHAKYPEELDWQKSVYVCSTRRSLGQDGEWVCPDCNFLPPLYMRETE